MSAPVMSQRWCSVASARILLLSLLVAVPLFAEQEPKVWENYDFVPGNKVLFYTDFSDE